MIRVSPLHWYFREEHLQRVMGEMLKRGSPILKGYFDGEEWFLKEGTHRIRAASILKVEPILVPVAWGRSKEALVRAKYHAEKHGIWFPSVKTGISCGMKQPDIFERIALIFCRLLNRDTTERPRFLIEPLPGAAWGAAVYLGEPPKPFADHYAKKQIIKAEGLPESPGHFWRAAVAASAGEALDELERVLREALYLRINGDLAIWDQATGKPWPGVPPVLRIEARPHDPDPAELEGGRRKSLPSGR